MWVILLVLAFAACFCLCLLVLLCPYIFVPQRFFLWIISLTASGAHLRPFFSGFVKIHFLHQFWTAQLAEDNADNSSSSSTALPNLSIDEARCNNGVSKGSILCFEIK
jgi:hypothetical protein